MEKVIAFMLCLLYLVVICVSCLAILSWTNSLIANNNIKSIILEIKTANVKSLKY